MPLNRVPSPKSLRNEISFAFLVCVITAISSSAQTFTTLVTFNGPNGYDPAAQALVQGVDGNLYGTTSGGGLYGGGTVFMLTKGSILMIVHNFCAQAGCTDGTEPLAGLIQAADGDFYGTTQYGGRGVYPRGTFFKMTRTGHFTTLYSFCSQAGLNGCLDGWEPSGPLVQGVSGDIYGTTPGGGVNGLGMAFSATPDGSLSTRGPLSTLYSFCSQPACDDGQSPYKGLALGWDGNLYGTTIGGGSTDSGVVFKLTPDGQETVLYSSCSRGSHTTPFGCLGNGIVVQGLDGSLYGTSPLGGSDGDGTVFRLTQDGVLTDLHSFDGTDGSHIGSIIQATDGNFYGTTGSGGANGFGTIFRITPQGSLTTIHDFNPPINCVHDCYDDSGLMQATDGNLYGVYSSVGYDYSEVFRVEIGLAPFVQARPDLAKHGIEVGLLGQSLKGSTDVSFNGTPASFIVVSDTFIDATVPADAISGYVTVTTPSGTLTSNIPFHVIP